ncbi:MAG TPA: chemotaxis-specific protein-glutamate methyltransferase CheB [Kofleriaceae bacterium]|nr:chemotaxis-specific protein-glutamate methyltransferase CheB [Kofleriaceae bacterium]
MYMLRVLVAEDSATARLLIVSLLSSDPDISVVGQARNGEEAVALASELHPDVITMDIQMPVMDGLEATRKIVAAASTPVIMVSSLDPADVSKSMLAFNAGALAVLAKPAGPGTPRFEKDCRELIATVKALSEGRAAVAEQAAPATPPAPSPAVERSASSPKIEAIGIVASTGGPIALRAFFKALPAKCAPPIFIVQHIAAGFSVAFASWLHAVTDRPVKVAEDREQVVAGTVYIAPDDHQLAIAERVMSVTPSAPVDGARPSGTVMLASLAKSYGAAAAGVLLTGTGVDGVDGLRGIRDAGGAVFAQDEASCTTPETPRAAQAAGIVATLTPLTDISHRLANLVAGKPESKS